MSIAAALLIAAATLSAGAPARNAGDQGSTTVVYGGGAEGTDWSFAVSAPPGWKFDCCDEAKKHNANLLVFPRRWDKASPDRVMVLVVWKKKSDSIDSDWQVDASDYATKFPDAKAEPFDIDAGHMRCRSAVYVGADRIRNYVAFCDPGNEWQYRFGWSMSIQREHADLAKIETQFRDTISSTTPMSLTIRKSPR